MSRKFEIMTIDKKTRQVEFTSTLTTKRHLSDEELDKLIKAELKKPYFKNAIWRILR